jgi:thiosulfate dehydrogenase [quinone] large subunit
MDEKRTGNSSADLGATLAFLTLRFWLAARAIITGLEKFAGAKASEVLVEVDGKANPYGLTADASEKVYGFSHYHGVPEALYGQLEREPLIPGFALSLYDKMLGPALIIFGITLLIGVLTRISLFAVGLIYVSLTIGLILLKQDAGIAWLGIHILATSYALLHVQHNRFAISSKL